MALNLLAGGWDGLILSAYSMLHRVVVLSSHADGLCSWEGFQGHTITQSFIQHSQEDHESASKEDPADSQWDQQHWVTLESFQHTLLLIIALIITLF